MAFSTAGRFDASLEQKFQHWNPSLTLMRAGGHLQARRRSGEILRQIIGNKARWGLLGRLRTASEPWKTREAAASAGNE